MQLYIFGFLYFWTHLNANEFVSVYTNFFQLEQVALRSYRVLVLTSEYRIPKSGKFRNVRRRNQDDGRRTGRRTDVQQPLDRRWVERGEDKEEDVQDQVGGGQVQDQRQTQEIGHERVEQRRRVRGTEGGRVDRAHRGRARRRDRQSEGRLLSRPAVAAAADRPTRVLA